MITTTTFLRDSDISGHMPHTREIVTRKSITLATQCGCRLNRNLRNDRGALADAEALRQVHREVREAHLAEVRKARRR